MKEKRKHKRRTDSLRMFVKSNNGEARVFTTRDVSDGGLFFLALTTEQFPVGTEVSVWPELHAAGGAPPTIKARVNRISDQGMGIEFTEQKFS